MGLLFRRLVARKPPWAILAGVEKIRYACLKGCSLTYYLYSWFDVFKLFLPLLAPFKTFLPNSGLSRVTFWPLQMSWFYLKWKKNYLKVFYEKDFFDFEIHLLNVTYLTLTNTNVEVARKVEFLISKWEFNSYITSGIKILSVDPVFSRWVHVIKKAPIRTCYR